MKRAFLRAGIVGVVFLVDFGGGRRTHKSREFLLLLAEVKRIHRRVPVPVGSAQRGRPFQLEITLELDLHVQGTRGLNLDDDHSPGLAHRNEKRLAHRERVPGVENRAGLRPHREGASQRLRWNHMAVHQKSQVEIAQNFQRINPGLKVSRFVAQQSGALAHRRKKLPGTDRAREFKGSRRLNRTGRKRQTHQEDGSHDQPGGHFTGPAESCAYHIYKQISPLAWSSML